MVCNAVTHVEELIFRPSDFYNWGWGRSDVLVRDCLAGPIYTRIVNKMNNFTLHVPLIVWQ